MRRRFELALYFIALNPCLLAAAASESGSRDSVILPRNEGDAPERSSIDVAGSKPSFELSRIDEDVVTQFQKAWVMSNNGTNGREGLVLIFRMQDGGYVARLHRKTNEQRQVTFSWYSNIIAVVHTHPNGTDPRPSEGDKRIADRYNVPMFTITIRGMYVYDPAIKNTNLVQPGLDWLDLNKWKRFWGPSPTGNLLR